MGRRVGKEEEGSMKEGKGRWGGRGWERNVGEGRRKGGGLVK